MESPVGTASPSRLALVLEDDPVSRKILEQFLKTSGWNSICFGDAEAATQALDGPQMDLAFVDWNLPKASGIDFVAKVKKHPRQTKMKILMVTAETGLAQLNEALFKGADEYLMKPHTQEMVMNKLRILGF